MKGIILSGGTATRLFPLTATTSKQLLPVYDRQMIFYPLNTLIKAGIEDILGEKFINGDNVTMMLGDNILEDNIYEDILEFEKGGMIFAKEVSDDPTRYGIVEFDEKGKVISIEEKPKIPKSNFCVPGIYAYDSRVVEIAKNLKPSARGEIEITDINNEFLLRGELIVKKIQGEWLDAGTFDMLLEAGRVVKEKELYKSFDPRIEEAIVEFNNELKSLAKKKLL